MSVTATSHPIFVVSGKARMGAYVATVLTVNVIVNVMVVVIVELNGKNIKHNYGYFISLRGYEMVVFTCFLLYPSSSKLTILHNTGIIN